MDDFLDHLLIPVVDPLMVACLSAVENDEAYSYVEGIDDKTEGNRNGLEIGLDMVEAALGDKTAAVVGDKEDMQDEEVWEVEE